MVQPRRCAGHRHPVLSRPSAPDAAGAQEDDRRRRRQRVGMHAHPAPRNRACDPERLPAASPPRAGSSCSAPRPNAIPVTTDPIRPAAATCSICRLWYAQSHPDEDFAETFAVWLRPRSDWRRRYAGWPALKKLEYVDELMREIAGKKPVKTQPEKDRTAAHPVDDLARTLRQEAGGLCHQFLQDLRPRSDAASSPATSAIRARRRPRPSCARIAVASARPSRAGPANISLRSIR